MNKRNCDKMSSAREAVALSRGKPKIVASLSSMLLKLERKKIHKEEDSRFSLRLVTMEGSAL